MDDLKAEFIAEICSNHNGEIERALSLIDTAADIGCSGVKFQLFRIDQLFAPEVLGHPDYDHIRERKAWELPLEWIPVLAERCKIHGIKFGCTPFYLDAVEQLLPFVDFFKVASYEIIWPELVAAVARTGKPVVLSSGMATIDEVMRAARITYKNGCRDLTVLHCVSSYPTSLNEFNECKYLDIWLGLTNDDSLNKNSEIGWSDHSVNPTAIYHFYHLGAGMFEFHLDLLDKAGHEYPLGHCWTPDKIKPVIDTVRQLDQLETIESPTQGYTKGEAGERLWRADPSDGLRPTKQIRYDIA